MKKKIGMVVFVLIIINVLAVILFTMHKETTKVEKPDTASKQEMVKNEGKKLDFCILYGTDGKGSEGICGFIGQEAFAPDEATDDHLTGTATISVQTVPKWIEDDYDVAVTEDENGYPTQITLTKKS